MCLHKIIMAQFENLGTKCKLFANEKFLQKGLAEPPQDLLANWGMREECTPSMDMREISRIFPLIPISSIRMAMWFY
jgi:hypothetical protein